MRLAVRISVHALTPQRAHTQTKPQTTTVDPPGLPHIRREASANIAKKVWTCKLWGTVEGLRRTAAFSASRHSTAEGSPAILMSPPGLES